MAMQRPTIGSAPLGTMLTMLIISTPAAAFGMSEVSTAMQTTASAVQDLIAHGYRAAPALMLGLALLAVMPIIALAAPVFARARRSDDATRRYKPGSGDDVAEDIGGDALGLPAHAFLEIVGGPETRFAILRDMLRIGREDDNDIRIPSNAVHRYHAAIYREHSEDWHITDLSGSNGNGIRVNGQRCSDARLNDGDVIELGPGRLRFRAGLI